MVNPFYSWSGYYPGDKPLKGGGGRYSGYGGGMEYYPLFDVFGELDADYDALAAQIQGAPQAALQFFYDELKGDVKSAMKAGGGFTATGNNPVFSADQLSVEAREDWHEGNQLLGTADMKWDLNPVEYWKDPKGHLWKQVKGVWKSFANYEDLDTNYKRQFVDGLVNGISPTGLGGGLAVGAFAARTTRHAPAGTPGDTASALQLSALPGKDRGFDAVYRTERTLGSALTGSKGFNFTAAEVNADPVLAANFAASGKSMDDFLDDINIAGFSYSTADIQANDFLRKQWEESGLSLDDYADSIKGKRIYEEEVDVYQRSANTVPNYYANSDNPIGRRLQRANWYTNYVKTADGTFREMREDPARWNAYLAKFTDPNDRQNAIVTIDGMLLKTEVFEAADTMQKSIADLNKALGKQISSGFEDGDGLQKALTTFEGELRRSQIRSQRVRDFYLANGAPELADKWDDLVGPYERYLEKLEQKTVKYRGRVKGYKDRARHSLFSEADARAFSNELSGLVDELAGKDVWNEGVKTKLLERYITEELENFSDDTSIGFYAVDFEGLRRMGIWNHRIAGQEYIREAYGDLIRHFFDGKILETYIWSGRIKGRIKSFTPSFFVTEFMKKNHYFGLSIDTKYLAKYEKGDAHLLFRPMGWLITKSPASTLFVNRITVDIKDKDGKLLYGIIKATGGDHFKMAKALVKLRKLGRLDDFQIMTLLSANLTDKKEKANILKLFKDIELLEDYNTAEEFLKGIQALQDWLKAEGAKLGIFKKDGTIDPTKIAALTSFLNWVEKRAGAGFNYIDMARKYAGGLEKLTSVLNRAQSFVGQKLGKWAKPISYVKYAIAEAIADIVAGAVEVGSGGTGTVVIGAVRKLVKGLVVYVEDKLIDGAKAFMSALKGGFDDLWELGAQNLRKTAKRSAYISLGCAFPMLLGLLVFMGLVSTISPENPTKSPPEGVSYSGPGGGGSSGDCDVTGPCDPGGDPIPPGSFGTGVGCSGSMSHPTGAGTNNCVHWDGYRPLDIFAAEGAPGYAPYDGTAYLYDNPGAGGYALIFHPTNNCFPSTYYAHNREERVSGPVTAGQQVVYVSYTGSACKPENGVCTGAPHIHFGASTNGYFYTESMDICTVQLLLDNVPGNTCNTGMPEYGGTPCCHSSYPQRNGCFPAYNQ